MKNRIIMALALSLSAAVAAASEFEKLRLDNWHHWRGPNADGISPNANPPLKWDESTNIKWKVALPGEGRATPIIWQNKIFVLAAVPTAKQADAAATPAGGQTAAGGRQRGPGQQRAAQGQRAQGQERRQGAARGGAAAGQRQRRGGPGQGRGGRSRGRGGMRGVKPTSPFRFVVLCLDRDTGKTLWQKVAIEELPHEGRQSSNTFASGSPTTDGQRLYASFGSRGIFCHDLDGNLLWKRDLGDMQTRAGFGEGVSPVVHGDSLIVTWDHEGDSFIYCLDAATGADRWKVARDEPTTWNTPLITEHNGTTQVIVNGTVRTRSYDLADGRLIWECGGQATNPIACPVRREELVFCMTGYRGYALNAISLNSSGDVTDSDKVAWKRGRGTPYVSSPIVYGDQLYFLSGLNDVLTSVDAASGKEHYAEERLGVGRTYASLVGAANRIYVSGLEGTTMVLRHGPELKVLAENKLDEPISASPVVLGKQLFLRGARHLYCIAEQ